jgi:chromosome segregation protein
MRLSRLEVKGFKSFANETVIHFNENVTGIVGPNGSGKSNIVDAIRWVLGEQKSTELRLDKMSSVIFNGTKIKKPAGMAQVSLIFENSKNILPVDFNEVKVTRILYQSGESEYRLNNVTCRLKDINNLFTDTGVGSNTYAIIGFGMVEDLLNNKDNYRRMMIEQAAGISIFKTRKKETLAKLQITMDDLTRVDDLLSEIESNMNSLKKQARRAEKFLELKSKHKDNAWIIFHAQQIKVRKLIQSFDEKLQEGKLAAELKEMEIHKAESNLEVNKNELLKKEISLSEFQKKANHILDEQKSLEKKLEMTTQRISFVKSKAQQALDDLERLKSNLSEISDQRASLSSKIPDIETAMASLYENQASQQAIFDAIKSEINNIESNIKPMLEQYDAQNTKLFTLEKENAIAQAQLTAMQGDIGRFKNQTSALIEQHKTIQIQQDEYQIKSNQYEQQIAVLKSEIDAHNLQLQEVKSNREQVFQNKKDLERQIDQSTHEIKLLKSLIDNQEGFPEAVKHLTSQQKSKELNLVADLINCDEKYRTSLENYLQPYLAHIVVQDYPEALHYIDQLSSSQKGKAGFIILDAYQEKMDSPITIDDAIPLSAIIECHPMYKKLFDKLLHKAYIVDDLNEYHIQLLKNNQDISFVSADGSIIASLGLTSGGSIGLIEGNILGRKLRLETLEKNLIQLKHTDSNCYIQLAELDDTIKLLHSINKTPQLETLVKQNQQTKDSLIQFKVKSEHFQLQLEKLTLDEANLKQKIDHFYATIQNNVQPIAEIKSELEALNTIVNNNKEALKSKATTLNEATQQMNNIKLDIIRLEGQKTGLLRELNLLDKQADSFIEQEKLLQATQSMSLLEIAALESQFGETENAIITVADQFKKSQSELTEVERLYFSEKKNINEIEQSIKLLQKNLTNIQTITNEWKDKWNASNYELKRIEDNFEIEFGAIDQSVMTIPEIPEELGITELEQQNIKIKNAILQFGEINPLAMEAFQEIKSRFETIVTQKNDILDSKDKLTQTLNELENSSTSKYLAAFEKVRDNFKMVFRSLFTDDDDCDLIITNPGNPLDSDIGIIAKPKGKRPQSLSQLSGGEKTLTAIAFLFALYLLKPAPFCIFDELDAPLDDTNVEKLNKIIRKFSNESQFIIITHNKSTMAAVDVMYGVYMEHQGISGLSKVDFRSFEHNLVLEKI